MIKNDNMQAKMTALQMEVVRLTNEVARLNGYIAFVEEENHNIERETREECRQELEMTRMERDRAKAGIESANKEIARERQRADSYFMLLVETREALSEKNVECTKLKRRVSEFEQFKDAASLAEKACVDAKDIINVINRRVYQRNSDATRFLNGEIDPHSPMLEEESFMDIIKHVMDVTSDNGHKITGKKCPKSDRRKPRTSKKGKEKSEGKEGESRNVFRSRRVYTATILEEMGIDCSNLPKNSKLIRRKDKQTGEDIWYVYLFFYSKPSVTCKKYKIGRFNIPGKDPDNSNYPIMLMKDNGLMPSFARFYLDSKFNLNLSENRIIQMLKSMHTRIPQSTLNRWMHQIISMLRERLEPLMLEAIRQSKYTNNDGTRLLVRSREAEDMPFKYQIEYIQAALSEEKKIVVMLYDEGTRDHSLQENKIFKDSSIRGFIADRAPQYKTIVDDLESQNLIRQACWFHFRHYLVDAYLVDVRMEDILILCNSLFYIERSFGDEEDQSPEARQQFRWKWSKPIVDRIVDKLKKMRAAGDEYGKMVHRAIDYLLDDEEAFKGFLYDGHLDMHNIAIERCFRHIAIGRRNWLHTGSHQAAQNIAFMFGLLESCKLNNVDFGIYIEDILTRIMYGEHVDTTFLPCGYVTRYKEGQDAA